MTPFRSLAAVLSVLCFFSVVGQNISGSFCGDLNVGGNSLPLVLNFTEESGTLRCTLDSPAQGARGIVAVVDFCDGDSVAVGIPVINAAFRGRRVSDTMLRGMFSQSGYNFPLELTREATSGPSRPQTPSRPFPYTAVDTVFYNSKANVSLGAIVVMPQGASVSQRVPVVVMVSGSGLQNRDEEIFDHKPFLVIADFLARMGIGSVRYDDRGTGHSTGDGLVATTADFMSDAEAAIAFARTLPWAGNVGVLGHSEGGTIAFMLGSRRAPDFIVSMAGAIVPGKDVLLAQNRDLLLRAGQSDRVVNDAVSLLSAMFDEVERRGDNGDFTKADMDSIATALGVSLPPALMSHYADGIKQLSIPWMRYFIAFDPAEDVKSTQCQVMAINGDMDSQVDAVENLEALKSMLPDAQVKIYKGLNHLFQHCVTGQVDEYYMIEETISPEVLDDIAGFIKKACQPVN